MLKSITLTKEDLELLLENMNSCDTVAVRIGSKAIGFKLNGLNHPEKSECELIKEISQNE
jgi:hypothetical protein